MVHTRPANATALSIAPIGTYPCKSPRCKTCPTIFNRVSIVLGHTRFAMEGQWTCKSTNVVYIISCSTCNVAYIGETGCRLQKRMNGLRHTIRHQQDTPVADHFQQPGHDLPVSVLQATPQDVTKRRALERSWIVRFQNSSEFQTINRDDGLDLLLLPHLS